MMGEILFLEEVYSFSEKHNIIVPSMDDFFIVRGRLRRKAQEVTNMHHFDVELFCSIIDMQLQELNDHFTEESIELLLCLAFLGHDDLFSTFDKKELIHLAEFYPEFLCNGAHET